MWVKYLPNCPIRTETLAFPPLQNCKTLVLQQVCGSAALSEMRYSE